jgi:hypothetical protein
MRYSILESAVCWFSFNLKCPKKGFSTYRGVREISIYFDFAAFYFTAQNRKLRKVPREFFKL